MIRTTKFKDLHKIEKEVLEISKDLGRTTPEIRFFSLDAEEFMSLLEKGVYPASPMNIWEGKNVIKKRFMNETGRETGIYYEVVQTGNPSYAYLNENNSLTTQASVMAHVVGHCEFSEINVLKDSDRDRSEKIIYLVSKIENSIKNMGHKQYTRYRNACESLYGFAMPSSQYSLINSVETNSPSDIPEEESVVADDKKTFSSYSYTLQSILQPIKIEEIITKDEMEKVKNEIIDRRGYRLKAPCQDILGFLSKYAPCSSSERYVLEYMYSMTKHHQFVIKTQVMNEGWAIYWEHKIMMEMFKKKSVKDVIDYCKVFSGVCVPRPYFMRNPYHLGYNMWKNIEELYRKGKVCIEYAEEKDVRVKEDWNRGEGINPIERMENIVKTTTDCEFLRRFLTYEMIEEFFLNRIPIQLFLMLRFPDECIKKASDKYIWIEPKVVKDSMLDFFVDFGRPAIYIIDTDFQDGGLLLYHRHKGRDLKEDWIGPALKNINHIWKAPTNIVTQNFIYTFSGSKLLKRSVSQIEFEEVRERLANDKKPIEI